MTKNQVSKGFTLIEALVALAIITLISLLVLGAVGPWLGLKQSIETDRKLNDIKQGLLSYYEANAMAVDSQGGGALGPFVRGCDDQTAAFQAAGMRFSDSPPQMAVDGYKTNWCFFISEPLVQQVDGVAVWHRNVAVVSPGIDLQLDTGTTFDEYGTLTIGGDDKGITLSGLDIQTVKLRETLKRMNRVAAMYEAYFTSRFMSYADRDISRYYFSVTYDTTGSVGSTGGGWAAVSGAFYGAVSPTDAVSAYEIDNNIELGNSTETVNELTVRSPETTGTGTLPYTALLRAKMPSPDGTPVFATHVVIGNY